MLVALSLFGTVPQSNNMPYWSTFHSTGSGTIFCGMAPSMNALIFARAVAGMGGGGSVRIPRILSSSSVSIIVSFNLITWVF